MIATTPALLPARIRFAFVTEGFRNDSSVYEPNAVTCKSPMLDTETADPSIVIVLPETVDVIPPGPIIVVSSLFLAEKLLYNS